MARWIRLGVINWILIAVMINQVAFLPVAWAQTDAGTNNNNNNPFSGFDNPPACDPFSDPNCTLNTGNTPGGVNYDPNSIYTDPGLGGYWGGGLEGYGNYAGNDLVTVAIMQSGAFQLPYRQNIQNLRKALQFPTDDVVADHIVRQYSWQGFELGFTASVIPELFAIISGNPTTATTIIGTGLGFGAALFQLQTLFKWQAEMILSLAELYGVMPDTISGRISLVLDCMIWDVSLESLEVIFKRIALAGLTPAPLIPPVPPIGPAAAEVAKVATGDLAQEAAQGSGRIAHHSLQMLSGIFSKDTAAPTGSLTGFISKLIQTRLDQAVARGGKAELIAKALRVAGPAGVRALVPVISGLWGWGSMRYYGHKFQVKLKAEASTREVNAVYTLRHDTDAKTVVYVTLFDNVFKRLDAESANHYKVLAANIFPISSAELNDILNSYAQDPSLLTKALANCRDNLSLAAKLYLVKFIMNAMLMKGYFDRYKPKGSDGQPTLNDQETLDSVAVGLGVKLPPKMDEHQLRADDDRLEGPYQYRALVNQLQNAIYVRTQADNKQHRSVPAVTRWKSGKITYEDFQSVKKAIDCQDQIKKDGGLSPVADELCKDAGQAALNRATKPSKK